jgi:hypothetical protein
MVVIRIVWRGEGNRLDKGKGIVSSKVDGCDKDCVEGLSSCDIMIPPCMDMELYSQEKPLPLISCPQMQSFEIGEMIISVW